MTQPRILVVDDERSLLITLAANLELEGFDVTTAESPITALALVKEQSFDLVLSDIRMPKMSGVELFREIRRLHPKMPVILMSAFALEETIKSAIHEGVFAMLSKPFDPDHAAAVLWKALRGSVVLVIDDSESDATTTTAALQSAGVKARAIFNREQATQEISAGDVDVCVLDLVMPGVDTEEFMRQIRANNSSIAIIAVSGYDVPELLRKVSSLGIYAFQQKPFNPDELIQLIAKARAKDPARDLSRKG